MSNPGELGILFSCGIGRIGAIPLFGIDSCAAKDLLNLKEEMTSESKIVDWLVANPTLWSHPAGHADAGVRYESSIYFRRTFKENERRPRKTWKRRLELEEEQLKLVRTINISITITLYAT